MMTQTSAKGATRQFFTKMLAGAVFGAASAALFLYFVGEDRLEGASAGSMIAIIAGLSYFLMGLAVGFGVIAPGTGARFLNVEDADELREERAKLTPSAIACALIGIFFLVLALAPGGADADGRNIALVIAFACIAGVVLITIRMRNNDELIRQIGLESSTWTLNAGLVILAIWATLAHLGYAGWVEPLGLIAGASMLHLCAIFWISAKKGLMRPR